MVLARLGEIVDRCRRLPSSDAAAKHSVTCFAAPSAYNGAAPGRSGYRRP